MADYPFESSALLPSLKTDLQITTDAYNDRLVSRLDTAMERITAMGISLKDTPGDQDLVLMYAAWLWRSRAEQAGMGRMLQLALNNRLFGQVAAGGSADG